MSTLPKPQDCAQNWLEMTPTEKGRVCGACDKLVIDFSKKSWSEIVEIQKQHNNSACGMYQAKQLEHWGTDVPDHKSKILKAAAVVGLTVSLASSSLAQSSNKPSRMIITGKLIDEMSKEEIPFATVEFSTAQLRTETDQNGEFLVIVEHNAESFSSDSLEIKSFGYESKKIALKDLIAIGEGINNIVLEADEQVEVVGIQNRVHERSMPSYYGVRVPTKTERVKWRLKNIFKRKGGR